MRAIILFAVCLAVLCSCSSTKKAQSAATAGTVSTAGATDDNYGFSKDNPVKVGGQVNGGPAAERAYLSSLTGPNGEPVTFQRKGSCCPFKTPNGIIDNTGMLDHYEVTYEGLDKPVIVFINMYDKGELKALKGFRFKN